MKTVLRIPRGFALIAFASFACAPGVFADQAPRPAAPAPAAAQPAREVTPAAPPSEATLGVPVYPTAQYLGSYDAGRGQRFHLFGVTATFPQVVAYYRTILNQKGDLVFEQPATQMFEVGRYREDTMAFPPGVTVKDYTWGGSAGYPFAKPDGTVTRYPTVVQIVAVPDVGR